jgi:hypothetical protein
MGARWLATSRQKENPRDLHDLGGFSVVAGARFGRGASEPGAGVIEFSFRAEA